jgi:hypothetical protein
LRFFEDYRQPAKQVGGKAGGTIQNLDSDPESDRHDYFGHDGKKSAEKQGFMQVSRHLRCAQRTLTDPEKYQVAA